MIGNTISAKPDRSNAWTKRASTRRRRAVSATSSGLTPVGYRDLLAISKKPLPRGGEEVVWSCLWFRSSAPLLNAGRSHSAPLHQMMMVVMHVANDRVRHKSCASVETRSAIVKFHTMARGHDARRTARISCQGIGRSHRPQGPAREAGARQAAD